jgi:hypothetical protein
MLNVTILLLGLASLALAVPTTPEIDAGSATTAMAVFAGAIVMLRSRRRRG